MAREQELEKLLEEVYLAAKADLDKPVSESQNEVKRLYEALDTMRSQRGSALLTPPDIEAEVEILYQSIEGLHRATPDHKGDWYFTGDYPTPGGNRVANRAYINFIESSNERAY